METAESRENAGASAARSGFVWSKLGSALALLPLGVWTVNHLWDNLAAFRGAAAWEEAVTAHPHPLAHGATLVIVLLPLLLHTVWGLQRLKGSRPNNQRYGYYGNLKYALQRLSAIGVLGFLGAHIWLAMLEPRLVHHHAETFQDISCEMGNHGPTLVVYLLGTLGVAYHLGNGLQTAAMGWGVVTSRRGLKRLEWLGIGSFLVLLAMSWAAVYALYRVGHGNAVCLPR